MVYTTLSSEKEPSSKDAFTGAVGRPGLVLQKSSKKECCFVFSLFLNFVLAVLIVGAGVYITGYRKDLHALKESCVSSEHAELGSEHPYHASQVSGNSNEDMEADAEYPMPKPGHHHHKDHPKGDHTKPSHGGGDGDKDGKQPEPHHKHGKDGEKPAHRHPRPSPEDGSSEEVKPPVVLPPSPEEHQDPKGAHSRPDGATRRPGHRHPHRPRGEGESGRHPYPRPERE